MLTYKCLLHSLMVSICNVTIATTWVRNQESACEMVNYSSQNSDLYKLYNWFRNRCKNLFKLMLISETPIQLKDRTCGNIAITQYVAFALENNIFIISINHEL